MYRKLLAVLLLLAMCFPVVLAVDYTGSLVTNLPGTQITTSIVAGSEKAYREFPWIINWSTNFDSVGVPAQIQMYSSYDNYAVASGVPFTLNDANGTYATGTITMTNGTNFYPGAGKQSYTFDFDYWDPGTRSGTILGNMSVPAGTNYFPIGVDIETAAGVTIGFARQLGTPRASYGYIYIPYDYVADFDYSITKVGGTGTGTISTITMIKSSSNNIASNLQVRNASVPNALIGASGTTAITGTDVLTVVGDNYRLVTYLPFNTKYYNTSTIFFPTGYGPTPTPTPTGTPVPSVPTGAVRTTVYLTDGSTGSKIVGGSIAVLDMQNLTWTNSTSSITGSVVDVLAAHTIDIYGSATGFTSSQGVAETPGGNYYLPLMPPIPTQPIGYVNVIVNVQDSATHDIVPSAAVSFRLPTGATTVESTGVWGTAQTVQPNNTVIIVGVSKSGYQSLSISLNSGTGADVIRTLQLTKSTVATPTPVVTDPGTGAVITAVPTILPGCEDPNSPGCISAKDSSMMAQLRDNGPVIVDLAIYAVILGLLGMILSGVMKWGK